MAVIFSIVGRSETGKTTLISALVSEIKRRGLSVGVIKHCPRGFDLDMEGKDSWRFKEAGADGIFLLSSESVGMLKDTREELSVAQIASHFFDDVDLVLTEGCPDGTDTRKIEVLRSSISQELLSTANELTAIVSDFDVGLDLPQFGPRDFSKIVDFMEVFVKRKDGELVDLKVNGKDVVLNPFAQNIFKNTVMGMVSSLRIEGKPEVVELKISVGTSADE